MTHLINTSSFNTAVCTTIHTTNRKINIMQQSRKRKGWFAILGRLTIFSLEIQYYYLGWQHIQNRSYFKINIVVRVSHTLSTQSRGCNWRDNRQDSGRPTWRRDNHRERNFTSSRSSGDNNHREDRSRSRNHRSATQRFPLRDSDNGGRGGQHRHDGRSGHVDRRSAESHLQDKSDGEVSRGRSHSRSNSRSHSPGGDASRSPSPRNGYGSDRSTEACVVPHPGPHAKDVVPQPGARHSNSSISSSSQPARTPARDPATAAMSSPVPSTQSITTPLRCTTTSK